MVVHGLLVVVASLVAEYRLWVLGLQYLQNLGSVVVVHGLSCSERDMWKLPRPGIEPLSPMQVIFSPPMSLKNKNRLYEYHII